MAVPISQYLTVVLKEANTIKYMARQNNRKTKSHKVGSYRLFSSNMPMICP